MEKLQIKNFAGLKDVTIEVAPITGFIGPQASGKSVIAKLLYFFREICFNLPAVAAEKMDNAQCKEEFFKRFIRYFPVQNTGAADFVIIYETGNENIHISFSRNKATFQESFKFEWSEFFSASIEKLIARNRHFLAEVFKAGADADFNSAFSALNLLREEYDKEAANVLGPWFEYERIFIPAGRSFFSQLSATVFTRLEAGETLDPFMLAFGSLVEQSKILLEARGFFNGANLQSPSEQRDNQFLRSTFNEIIRADVVQIDKDVALRFNDGRRVRIAQASSGQQEVLPLLLLLARLFSPHSRGRAVYIEEPEAHVFPSTQKQIIEFIAKAFRARNGKMCVILTTHSPYILTSINNLIQAGKLFAESAPAAKERLETVIPSSQTLNPGEVAFYALEDGAAKSIIDSETGLIDAEMIDSVSDKIATQFDDLLLEGNEKR